MNTISKEEIVDILKKNVEEKTFVDVSSGVEKLFNVSATRFKTALDVLRKEGYLVAMRIRTQVGTDKKVTIKVLSSPETTYKEVFDNTVHPIERETNDN